MTNDQSLMTNAGNAGLGYPDILRALNIGNRAFSTSTLSSTSAPVSGLPSDPAEWTKVVELADQHMVAALLYHQLEGSDEWAGIPAQVRERLRLAYYLNADRNIRRFHQLRPLLLSLRRAGIPVIVLKGACLAELAYGNVALRPMSDADLLVPKQALEQARAVLSRAGCAHASADIETECRIAHQLGVFDKDGLTVEVHWTIERPVSPFTIDARGLWDRARKARVADVEVLVLCPEDLLLHLCLHTVYHHALAIGLLAFCDIARLIEHYRSELDWSLLASRARDWGAAKYAALALWLSRDLIGAEVPEDILDQLVPGGIDPGLLETARECILTHTSCRKGSARPLHDVFGPGSLSDRMAVFWRKLLPPADVLAATYRSMPGSAGPPRRRALWLQHIVRSCWTYLLRPRLARLKLSGGGQGPEKTLADWLSRAESPEPD